MSASVFSKQCISSDAYATAVLVMGYDKAIEFLKQHPELDAYLIYSDKNGNYQVYQTSNLTNLITEVEK